MRFGKVLKLCQKQIFTNFRANQPNRDVEYIGLRNYERILTDGDIWLTMQATAHFLFWTIVLQVLIGFTLAWLINRKFKGNDLWTTLIVLPMMLSPAVVGNFLDILCVSSDSKLSFLAVTCPSDLADSGAGC